MKKKTKSLRYALLYLLAPLISGTAWFKDWQQIIGAKTIPHALQAVNPWMLLGTGTVFVVIGFVTKVWREVEEDAVKGAAAVLRAAPDKAVEILGRCKDVLVGWLNRWSPGFESKYRRRAYERFGLFNDRGLGLINANRLDLEQVYVELRIKSDVNPTRPALDPLNRTIEGREPIWTFLRSLRQGFAIVLLGAPGSGKTTLLQHLLLVFARGKQGRFKVRQRLPILLELRNLRRLFQKAKLPSFSDAIYEQWRNDFPDLKPPKMWLEHRLCHGRIIILLDGLDELPAASLRQRAARWLDEQTKVDAHRRCQFLLTSRPGGYRDARIERAEVLEVQAFSPDQSQQFINSWYLANEIVASGHRRDDRVRRLAAEEAAGLQKRLGSSPDIYALTVNPLLLTMVCMVHRYHGALPGSRSQLYEEICQVLLERWRQAREISDELRGDQKLAVLRPLAEQYMLRGVRELPEVDIFPIVRPHLDAVDFTGVDSELRFLRAIQSGSGLLLERDPGIWAWAHKTFQEYLAAEQWLQPGGQEQVWSGMVTSEWWRETILLFAAKADASAIVEAALADGSSKALGLALQLLSEAHKLSPLVREAAQAALSDALRSDDLLRFTTAAKALQSSRERGVIFVDEQLVLRSSPITQAEYQLFLDSMSAEMAFAFLPPHWEQQRFSGDPEAPIVGVFGFQAEGFCKSVSNGEQWRIPAASEVPASIAGPWTFCDNNGQIAGAEGRRSMSLGSGFILSEVERSFVPPEEFVVQPIKLELPQQLAVLYAIALGCSNNLYLLLKNALINIPYDLRDDVPQWRRKSHGIDGLSSDLLGQLLYHAVFLHPMFHQDPDGDPLGRVAYRRLRPMKTLTETPSEKDISKFFKKRSFVTDSLTETPSGKDISEFCKKRSFVTDSYTIETTGMLHETLILAAGAGSWWEIRRHFRHFADLLGSRTKSLIPMEVSRTAHLVRERDLGQSEPCETIFLVSDRREVFRQR